MAVARRPAGGIIFAGEAPRPIKHSYHTERNTLHIVCGSYMNGT